MKEPAAKLLAESHPSIALRGTILCESGLGLVGGLRIRDYFLGDQPAIYGFPKVKALDGNTILACDWRGSLQSGGGVFGPFPMPAQTKLRSWSATSASRLESTAGFWAGRAVALTGLAGHPERVPREARALQSEPSIRRPVAIAGMMILFVTSAAMTVPTALQRFRSPPAS
jgi:hypothetical protein